MKGYCIKFLFTLLAMAFVWLGLNGCDENTSVDPVEEQTERLARTWSVSSVFLDGFDVTSPTYEGFAILFRKDKSWWVPVERVPAFTKNGGFWEFNGNNLDEIIINEVVVSLEFGSGDQSLRLKFSAPGSALGEGSRSAGLSGDYEFNLVVAQNQITD